MPITPQKKLNIAFVLTISIIFLSWLVSITTLNRSQNAVDTFLESSMLMRIAEEGTITLSLAKILQEEIEQATEDLDPLKLRILDLKNKFLANKTMISELGPNERESKLAEDFFKIGEGFFEAMNTFIPIRKQMLNYMTEYDGRLQPLSHMLLESEVTHIRHFRALRKSVAKGELLVDSLDYKDCTFHKWYSAGPPIDADIAEFIHGKLDPLHHELHDNAAVVAALLQKNDIEGARKAFADILENITLLGNYFSGIVALTQERFSEAEEEFAIQEQTLETLYSQATDTLQDLRTYLQEVNMKASLENMKRTSSKNRSLILFFSILGMGVAITIAFVTVRDVKKQRLALDKSRKEQEQAKDALEIAHAFARSVLDSMSNPISIINANDYAIVDTNSVFLEHYGLTKEEVLGRTCYDIISNRSEPCALPEIKCPLQEMIASGRHVMVEKCMAGKTHHEISVSPIKDKKGRVIMGVHISQDITERKKAEREIIRARQEAEQANRLKSDFLANISHELRTPMHGILSFSTMGMEKAPTERLLRYFTRINESGARLLDLLNNLLDLSKLEAGHMKFEMAENDLAKVVDTQREDYEMLLKDKSLKLNVLPSDIDTHAYFDFDKMLQVVRNLLSNAIKFSPHEKTITISYAEETLPEGRRSTDKNRVPAVSLTVADEGIGIPADELEAVFDKFIQSSKTTTGEGGTGLGLAISKEIVEGHRGKIFARKNPVGGASIICIIPKEPPLERPKKRIGELLVEEGHISKAQLEEILERQRNE